MVYTKVYKTPITRYAEVHRCKEDKKGFSLIHNKLKVFFLKSIVNYKCWFYFKDYVHLDGFI